LCSRGQLQMQSSTIQVFVSSTWLDLQRERQAVEAVLQRLRELKFVGMEYFGSHDDTTRYISLAEVDRSQLYVGVFASRYGSGITEAEYRKAREKRLSCLIYFQADCANTTHWQEDDYKSSRLAALKEELRREHIVSEFSSPDDLAARLTADVHRWLVDNIYMPAATQASRCDYPLKQLESLLTDVKALGTRSVAIGGNNAGTIITGDIVFQILDGAPLFLTQHFRVHQFRTLIEERTRGFVGRDFIFEAIDNFISGRSDRNFRSGYVVVRGEPGIGKTALAGQLVKLRGYLHHFNIGSQNIDSAADFLGNVCAQLVVRYKLDHVMLPPAATQHSGFLSQLLAEAASKAGDLPLIIVIDGLDEAQDIALSPNANRLFLPSSLPEGVFFIVTTREKEEYRMSVDHRKDIFIRDMGEQNLTDVRQYTSAFIDKFREQMILRITAWTTNVEEFVEVITTKSQGNFMYLVHVLNDIRQGQLTKDNLDSIYGLPAGLKEYYQRHWRTMRSQDPARFQDYYEPVVCILASARESVPIAQLVQWTKHKWPHLDSSRIRDVIRVWREFLNEDRSENGVPVFRIYHTSFQDFLKEEAGLTAYHEEIVMSALRKIPGFPDVGSSNHL
jgi:hypothetical protein